MNRTIRTSRIADRTSTKGAAFGLGSAKLKASSPDARGGREPDYKRRGSKLVASQGLGLVEIIVAVAIITLVFTGLLRLVTLEVRTQTIAAEESGAYLLAREALEATRSARDEDWAAFAGLSTSTPYYPVLQGGEWELSASDPGPVGVYERRIEIEEVYRDANDDIAPSGTPDADTRKITAYISWTSTGSINRTVELSTYLTNWQAYK